MWFEDANCMEWIRRAWYWQFSIDDVQQSGTLIPPLKMFINLPIFFFFENRKTMIDLRRIISTKGWIHASLELNTWTSTNITIKILFFLSSNFRWKKNVKYTLSICFQSIKALFFCRFTSFFLILTLSYGLSIKKILRDSLFILHFNHSSFFLKQFKIFSLNFVN